MKLVEHLRLCAPPGAASSRRLVKRFGSGGIAALLLLSAGSTSLGAQEPGTSPPPELPPLSAADVAEDFDSLLAAVDSIHPDPFRAHRRSDWLARKATAVTRAPLSRAALYAHILGSIALAEDGHTDAYPSSRAAGVRAAVPVKFVAFPGGLYVVATAERYRQLLGARVLAIEGRPTGEVLDTVRAIVPSDNEWGKRELLEDYLRMPALLAALGVADSSPGLQVTIPAVGGERTVVTIAPGDVEDALPVGPPRRPTPEGWLDARSDAGRPIWQRHLDRPFWHRVLPEMDALYLQVNLSLEPEPGDFAAFVDALPVPARGGPERLIVDLRTNRGGDATILAPLVAAAIRHWDYLSPGSVFVLTSTRTFSAAVHLAAELERSTHATFVGEPTGAPPNHFADVQTVSLPNSGVEVEISALYWQKSDPRDERAAIYPDVEAPLTWEDFVAGRDPALAAIRELDPDDPRLRRERPPVYNWLRESQRRN